MATEDVSGAGTRGSAITIAQEWARRNPLFLDTETTGLDYDDEVLSVAIVDLEGKVLLDTLVKPRVRIHTEAAAIHRITEKDIESAPSFDAILPLVLDWVGGRTVIMWNADFDDRMLKQSIADVKIATDFTLNPQCAMELYAQFYGEWDEYHGNFRWQKLSDAARQCELEIKWEALHSARVDADLCRQIVGYISKATGQPPEE